MGLTTAPEIHLDASPPETIIRIMLTLKDAAQLFLGDCARRGFTARTINTYWRTYEELNERLPQHLDVAKITSDDLRRYLATKTRLAPGTVAGIEAHLASLFKWLLFERKIAKDPMATIARTKRQRPEDLDVKTVSSAEVQLMLMHADSWPERLAMGVLAYLGPRRHAVAMLRLSDYDRARGRIRFQEKGKKVIWKPVPDELDSLIEAALAAGVYEGSRKFHPPKERAGSPYLIPPEGYLQSGQRDDRVIWRLVKRVADRAGVEAHVHALRAAFACFYDESNPGDTMALRDLMGHRSVQTTEIYLRRRNKERGMEPVRKLSWGVSLGERDGELVRLAD